MWKQQMARRKFTPEELHARLIVTIGILLALVFAGSVFAMLYALVFVTQPMAQLNQWRKPLMMPLSLTLFLPFAYFLQVRSQAFCLLMD